MKSFQYNILIGTPLSKENFNIFPKCIEGIRNLEYPKDRLNWAICIDTDFPYLDKLNSLEFPCKVIILNSNCTDKNCYVRIVEARNKIRDYFLAGNYEYYFGVCSDIIIPSDSLIRMLSLDKDIVAGVFPVPPFSNKSQIFSLVYFHKNRLVYTFYYFDKLPCKPFKLEEGGSMADFTLMKRKVLEKIVFRIDNRFPWAADDIFFTLDTRNLGFESWIIPDLKAIHEKGGISWRGSYWSEKS